MATLNSTGKPGLAPRPGRAELRRQATGAELMRFLAVSPSSSRRRLIRAAAEAQAWDAVVCSDVAEFLRQAFRRRVSLIVVDLSHPGTDAYDELQQAAEDSARLSDALLLISGRGECHCEEVWARSLGAWSYLPDFDSEIGFGHMLDEARDAIARRHSVERPAEKRHYAPPN